MSSNLQAGRIRNPPEDEIAPGPVKAGLLLTNKGFQFRNALVSQLSSFKIFHFLNSLRSASAYSDATSGSAVIATASVASSSDATTLGIAS